VSHSEMLGGEQTSAIFLPGQQAAEQLQYGRALTPTYLPWCGRQSRLSE
jgi:hypothetical protein